MLAVQNITYRHPDKELLFERISFAVNRQEKAALIGNNGSGKSTLLKIMAGVLLPSEGSVAADSHPYHVPQHFGQFNQYSVAHALRVEAKIHALHEILHGNASDEHMAVLDEDWTIEERCEKALALWKLQDIPLNTSMAELSGGEKTKVFLAGILIHRPEIVLLDEPTNHLDTSARDMLYEYVRACTESLVVVSHDRTLLRLLGTVYELGTNGITVYGGNYDFYLEQRKLQEDALFETLRNTESELKKARRTERETLERKQKSDGRGKKKLEKAGVPRIVWNKYRDTAEASATRIKSAHTEKIESMSDALQQTRRQLPASRKMKMDFESSTLHAGKVLVTAEAVNHSFGDSPLWSEALSFQIRSGERVRITGPNGSGKTTLMRLMLGEIVPTEGTMTVADSRAVYIDQDYSMIDDGRTVYEQVQVYNEGSLEEHEIKIRLNRFLFGRESWDKSCGGLSGGEKMRLLLCCMMVGSQAPDVFVLDEPTNNLDMQNTEILTNAINDFRGTIIVVSHDREFLEDIRVEQTITL